LFVTKRHAYAVKFVSLATIHQRNQSWIVQEVVIRIQAVQEVVIRIQARSFSNIADGMLHKRQVKAFLRIRWRYGGLRLKQHLCAYFISIIEECLTDLEHSRNLLSGKLYLRLLPKLPSLLRTLASFLQFLLRCVTQLLNSSSSFQGSLSAPTFSAINTLQVLPFLKYIG